MSMDEHPEAGASCLRVREARRTHSWSSAVARSLGERLGLPELRGRSALVCALLIDSLGTGLFLPFAVLYATVVARIPVATTGIVLSLSAAAALPVAPLGGALVDRYGGQRIVIVANLLQALGFAGYPFIASPVALLACSLGVAVGNQLFWAADGSFVAEIASPDQRGRWFALQGACRSAGLGGGALLSGMAIALLGAGGYRALAGANALSFVAAALLLARVTTTRPHAANSRLAALGASDGAPLRRTLSALRSLGGYRPVLRDRPFLGFTATNIAFSLITLSSSIALPVYILGSLRQPVWTPGLLFGMNTALVVAAQTTVARWCERYRRTRALTLAAGLFAVALLMYAGLPRLRFLAADSQAWLLVGLLAAMLVYTAAVLVMAPLKNALVADAAPDALRGRYVAFYHLSWSIASTIAPALLTTLLALGAGWLWLTLVGVALVAVCALIRLDSALPQYAIRSVARESRGAASSQA